MELLFTDAMGQPLWMWLGFLTLVLVLLVLDLGVLNRKNHDIGMSQSLLLSAFYISLGLAFGGFIWWELGPEAGMQYLTGFVVEKSLAMDNIFVIAMIFGYFAIPKQYQHRVLVYGILGVVVLRGIMIAAGAAIVQEYHWVLYLFAAFLVFTGIKMLVSGDEAYDVSANPVFKFMSKRFRVTPELYGEKFIVRRTDPLTMKRQTWITPLLLALVMVELADVIFAVDSIPAIFAITTDPYLVFTSNIFAILGLRALYFALASLIHRFVYLKYALSLVLVFIGGKIFVADALGLAKIPPMWSLSITLGILLAGILGSLWSTRHEHKAGLSHDGKPSPAAAAADTSGKV
ncbi:tellurite resistance protein TerC [Phyllobacterium sp. CL33Tsu]|uniref:TerC family protein n=1 Tax=Phyllobacterium sp. CL33Tsu TaxID=1798191 RepID=UPI0008EADE91|nr:TerC family protein [Phyllobacterium sp. CL33Tsu]SFI83099.1 tellurite resistance protein TerC [Phyllobacterium sp. CL33Tsu]